LVSATCLFYPALGQPAQVPSRSQVPKVSRSRFHASLLALSLLAAGCSSSYSAARLTQPVSMSPMADATLSAEAGTLFLKSDLAVSGMQEETELVVEIGITNAGPEPYVLNTASISCWMELSPDQPGETLSLMPAAGGEGTFPETAASQDLQLGSTTIPPGQTRKSWVMFRGYRYPGSDVPRKITIWFPDARGRRVQLVIADPARGQLRWEVKPLAGTMIYGVENSTLFGPELTGSAVAAMFGGIRRSGPLLFNLGITARTFVMQRGSWTSPTSSFTGTGWYGYVTLPLAGWGGSHDPRQFGVYGGGELQVMYAIQTRESAAKMSAGDFLGAAVAEGGVEVDVGTLRPGPSPFPISYTTWSAPRWAFRLG
jgi:hypothetical protein